MQPPVLEGTTPPAPAAQAARSAAAGVGPVLAILSPPATSHREGALPATQTGFVANLAVYLRALHEELGVLSLAPGAGRAFDAFFAIDRAAPTPAGRFASAWRAGSLAPALRLGQYGVHTLPAGGAGEQAELATLAADPASLRRVLETSGWRELVLVDGSGCGGWVARAIMQAADHLLVAVRDADSLAFAGRVRDAVVRDGRDPACVRVALLGVDRRSRRFADGSDPLARLREQIELRGWPSLRGFTERDDDARALLDAVPPRSVLHRAPGTALHRRLRAIAEEISDDLGLAALRPARRRAVSVRREAAARLAASRASCARAWLLGGVDAGGRAKRAARGGQA